MQAFADQANPPSRNSSEHSRLSGAYYNEYDPFAAQWLRNLIRNNLIADGEVDERSIEDVMPDDVRPFRQCHFFAGIGVWSYALRKSGWADDRQVWTGSCPCQPFSAAGKGAGFDDERHLWPSFFHLIEQCQPSVILGEQVASKDAGPWIDLVQADMEALDYAFGAVPFPSAGIGAPHIRDRLYWMAHAESWRKPTGIRQRKSSEWSEGQIGRYGAAGGLGNTTGHGREEWQWKDGEPFSGRIQQGGMDAARTGEARFMAYPRREGSSEFSGGWYEPEGLAATSITDRPTPTNGFWRDVDWLGCRDGKWRPVEPGTFPLASGAPARVGRLRGYGNAINAEAAHAFIEVVMECIP